MKKLLFSLLLILCSTALFAQELPKKITYDVDSFMCEHNTKDLQAIEDQNAYVIISDEFLIIRIGQIKLDVQIVKAEPVVTPDGFLYINLTCTDGDNTGVMRLFPNTALSFQYDGEMIAFMLTPREPLQLRQGD